MSTIPHTPKNHDRVTQKDIDNLFPEYRDNLATAIAQEVKIAHNFDRNGTPHGGLTLAYQKLGEGNASMFAVTAVYCNPTDVFVKKFGTALALQRFYNGEFTYIDVGRNNVEHAGSFLKLIFSGSGYIASVDE